FQHHGQRPKLHSDTHHANQPFSTTDSGRSSTSTLILQTSHSAPRTEAEAPHRYSSCKPTFQHHGQRPKLHINAHPANRPFSTTDRGRSSTSILILQTNLSAPRTAAEAPYQRSSCKPAFQHHGQRPKLHIIIILQTGLSAPRTAAEAPHRHSSSKPAFQHHGQQQKLHINLTQAQTTTA
ncbi:Hypothetical predicted protein, partial [Scomber scombrus]